MIVYLTDLGHGACSRGEGVYAPVVTMSMSLAQRAGEQPTAGCFGAFALRAPETIIDSDFGPGVDIWAVGCIVRGFCQHVRGAEAEFICICVFQTFELLVGRWLFHPEEGEGWTVEDDHLAKMMELTGQSKFPESMLGRARRREEFFDDAGMYPRPSVSSLRCLLTCSLDAGNLLRIPASDLVPVSLEAAMANYKIPGLAEDEISKAADFIRACLRFDYMERATAEELKGHAFLADAFRC